MTEHWETALSRGDGPASPAASITALVDTNAVKRSYAGPRAMDGAALGVEVVQLGDHRAAPGKTAAAQARLQPRFVEMGRDQASAPPQKPTRKGNKRRPHSPCHWPRGCTCISAGWVPLHGPARSRCPRIAWTPNFPASHTLPFSQGSERPPTPFPLQAPKAVLQTKVLMLSSNKNTFLESKSLRRGPTTGDWP